MVTPPHTSAPEDPYAALGLSDFVRDCRKRQLLEHYMQAYNPALAFELGILPAETPWMEALPKDKREETTRLKLQRRAYSC